MALTGLVISDRADGVATITLDSPANRNALSARLLRELGVALDSASDDGDVRVIVLTATGNVFCAGADLSDPPGNNPSERFGLPAILQAIGASPKPVIARVNGHTRAGGLGLLAACDVAIAPLDATFAFSEVRIGVAPAIIAVLCQPLMQPRAYARYTMTGAPFTAAEAATAGLLTAAVERDGLDHMVASLVEEFRLGAPSAIARTKGLIGELPMLPLAERFELTARISATQFQSDDAVEGIAAFLEKRPARWAR
jgi:enoyl-CoA hydratase/carnithine racemase